MSVNLMSKTYISKIECDKPQQDNFSVENLVSNDSDELKFRM
jgi:hypothetical protein